MIGRVRDRSTFLRLRTEGERIRGRHLGLVRLPAAQTAVAFAISRKVGTAVVRNRIRRRLREVLRTAVDVPPGIYLVTVRPSAAERSFAQLTEEMNELLHRLPASEERS